MPRFVLLRHEMPVSSLRPTHWDLMLERGGALRTWALDAEPRGSCQLTATRLGDHRLEYLGYQGEVSGGRGVVERVDEGRYETVSETDAALQIRLCGQRLRGRATLSPSGEDQRWSFVFVADADTAAGSSSS